MNINEILAQQTGGHKKTSLLNTSSASASSSEAFALALSNARSGNAKSDDAPFFMSVLSQNLGTTTASQRVENHRPVERESNKNISSKSDAVSEKKTNTHSETKNAKTEVSKEDKVPEKNTASNTNRDDSNVHEKSNAKATDSNEQKAVKAEGKENNDNSDVSTDNAQNTASENQGETKTVSSEQEANIDMSDKVASIITDVPVSNENLAANNLQNNGFQEDTKIGETTNSSNPEQSDLSSESSEGEEISFAKILEENSNVSERTQNSEKGSKLFENKLNTNSKTTDTKSENLNSDFNSILTNKETTDDFIKKFDLTASNKASHVSTTAQQESNTATTLAPVTDKQAEQLSALLGDSFSGTVKVKTDNAEAKANLVSTTNLVPEASLIEEEDVDAFNTLTKDASGKSTANGGLTSKTAMQLNENKGQAQSSPLGAANSLGNPEQAANKAQGQTFADAMKAAGHNLGSSNASSTSGQNGIDATQGLNSTQGAGQLAQNAKAKAATPNQPMTRTVVQSAIDQIKVNVSKGAMEGLDKINIKLRPKDLGHIEVKMELIDNKLTANITASRAETLEMLQKDVRALEKALNDAGLETDAGSLSFSFRGEEQQPQNQEQKNFANSSTPDTTLNAFGTDEDDLSATEMLISQSIASSRGGISIRV